MSGSVRGAPSRPLDEGAELAPKSSSASVGPGCGSNISFFTTCKPMKGLAGVQQRNALQSWLRIDPGNEVIVFGNDEGVAEVAAELGALHVPRIECNDFGTPLLSDMFRQAQLRARNQHVCYVNADIILTASFQKALRRLARKRWDFVMIGQRWDIEEEQPIDFSGPDWEERLHKSYSATRVLSDATALDYFLFPRRMDLSLPAFAVGRPAWDNWLVMHLSGRSDVRLINATGTVTVYHQAHGYQHVKQRTGQAWEGPEADRNRAVARQFSEPDSFYPHLYTVRSARWLLSPLGVVPAWTPRHLRSRLYAEYAPKLSGIRRSLALRSHLRAIIGPVWWRMKAVIKAVLRRVGTIGGHS